jgi:hypothetical protein
MRKGLLPENLPSVFSSGGLPAVLDRAQAARYLVTRGRKGNLAPFNASKRGEQRRIFSVPHPLFHHDISLFFERTWPEVSAVLARSRGSASKPRFPADGFRAVEITPQAELPTIRLKTLARKRFCLITDVSRCFPSVYTHAIPWALDGKENAKRDHHENSTAVRGNRLDFIIRQAQDGQTAGIPVGPDTSRLISELILSRVDADFVQKAAKKVYFVRHVDDYWIGGDTVQDCENHLRKLRSGLAEYQLDINESKTRIVPLAYAIGEAWPTELKREVQETFPRFNFSQRTRQHDLTALFAKVVDLAVRAHDEGIVKYVIRQIDRARSWDTHWEVLEPFLAHCAVQFPHSFDYVARVIAWRIRLDNPCDKKLWKEVALVVAAQASGVAHDSELLWALWLLKELGANINARQWEQYVRVSGPLVLAFLAHMTATGLTTKTGGLEELETLAIGNEQFTGSAWPLTLELYHLGQSQRLEQNRRAGDDIVGIYHAARASIIDWNSSPRVFERDPGEAGGGDWEPEYAIEDYASAYDDDDNDDRPRRVSLDELDDDDHPF